MMKQIVSLIARKNRAIVLPKPAVALSRVKSLLKFQMEYLGKWILMSLLVLVLRVHLI